MTTENLLDLVGYHKKWHATVQNIIEQIFDRIGVKNGFFVEFGAWDGIFGSNTRKLFNSGWSGILIEPEEDRFLELQKNYQDSDNVTAINSFVNPTGDLTFDKLVDKHVHSGIDFCSIDIDGLDLDVFESIEKHLPKVVCIEGGQMMNPLYKQRIPTELSQQNIQQGLYIMNESFEKKGYKILCTYQDTFFIKEEYYNLFNVKDDLVELYLDGILAYPRVPWILSTLQKVGLRNEIIDLIMSRVGTLPSDSSSESKQRWIDKNYSQICDIVEAVRQAYHKPSNNKE